MAHELPKLPYDFSALEPHIDARTMEIHHGKHHGTYTNNLNAALEKHAKLHDGEAEDILRDINSVPEDIRTAVRNNGGGFVNHNLFWRIMTPLIKPALITIADDTTGFLTAGHLDTANTERGHISEDTLAFRSLDRFEGNAKLSTWLHRIAVNAALMRLRARRNDPVADVDELLPSFSPFGAFRQHVGGWVESPEDAARQVRYRLLERAAGVVVDRNGHAQTPALEFAPVDAHDLLEQHGVEPGPPGEGVLGGDQVHGASHEVEPDHTAFGQQVGQLPGLEGAHARPEPDERLLGFLRLEPAEAGHGLHGRPVRRLQKRLPGQGGAVERPVVQHGRGLGGHRPVPLLLVRSPGEPFQGSRTGSVRQCLPGPYHENTGGRFVLPAVSRRA